MTVLDAFQTFVTICQTKWRNFKEDMSDGRHGCDNLQSLLLLLLVLVVVVVVVVVIVVVVVSSLVTGLFFLVLLLNQR